MAADPAFATAGERRVLVTEREMLLDHDRRLDNLDIWRAELRGAFTLMRLAFGASIVSGLVSVLALIQMMSGPR